MGTSTGQVLDFAMPKREDFSLVNIEVSVSTPGEHGVTNFSGSKISLTNGTVMNSFDYFSDPGTQNHLFGRLDQHALFRLGRADSRLKIPIPTVNDDFTITYAITILIMQYRFMSK